MAIKKQGGLGKGLEALFGGSAFEEINKVSSEPEKEVEEIEVVEEVVEVVEKKAKKVSTPKKIEVVKEQDEVEDEENDNRDKVRYLKLIDIEPNTEQPRRNFDEEALQELADSIKQYGVIQPIVVNYKGKFYEIVAGERRWRAAKMAGLKEIPAVIKNIDERKSKEIALIENVQREDLNAIEKARGLKVLMEDYNLTQEELAATLGKSRSGIANSLRILNLDERIIELAEKNKLTEGHCKALLAVKDPEKQYEMAMYFIETGGSVREAEKAMKVKKRLSKKPKVGQKYDVIYRDIEDSFRGFFGTKVKLNPKNESQGKIVIEYKNSGELERFLELIKK